MGIAQNKQSALVAAQKLADAERQQSYAATTELAAKDVDRRARELLYANEQRERALAERERVLTEAEATVREEKQQAARVLEQRQNLAVKEDWLAQQQLELQVCGWEYAQTPHMHTLAKRY